MLLRPNVSCIKPEAPGRLTWVHGRVQRQGFGGQQLRTDRLALLVGKVHGHQARPFLEYEAGRSLTPVRICSRASRNAVPMLGWRVVQAAGACAGVVLARATVRDRAAQMLSTLITVMAVAPLVGPLIGGQVLTVASWHWTFWLMVVAGAGLLVALFTIPETLPPERRDVHAVRHALGRYGELLCDPRNGLIVANSLAGALAAWPERAGAASALVGAFQAGSGILGSALVGRLADGTPWPLGLTMGLAGIGSFACTRLLPRL